MNRTKLLAILAFLFAAPVIGGAQQQYGRDSDVWRWDGRVESGRWMHVFNLNGTVEFTPSPDNMVHLVAEKRSNGRQMDDIHYEVVPAGGNVTWTTATAGCTVTGAVGAQSLGCTIGSLAQSATFTAVVSGVTSVDHCAAMDNTASVVAANADQVSDAGKITCLPTPTLQTTPNPTTGTMLATPLGDSATRSDVISFALRLNVYAVPHGSCRSCAVDSGVGQPATIGGGS